jgi:hypothetical protein
MLPDDVPPQATVAIGGAFLFLVRDSDRHVKTSTEAE